MLLSGFSTRVTPRLRIRSLEEADLDDLMAVNGDPQVTRFLPYTTWSTPADARAWRRRMSTQEATGTARQLVLVSREGGGVIGTLLAFRYEEESARAEIGYVLGSAHWRRGLMAEALRAFCEQAFQLGLRRLEAEVDPQNLASNALLAGLGFQREGLLRQRWTAKGRSYDTHLYGLLSAEWPGVAAMPCA